MPEKKKTPGTLKKVKRTTKPRKKVIRKPRKTTKKAAIDKDLRAIYADAGKMPNLKKLETKKGSWFKRFLVSTLVILVIIAAAAWAGFLLFKPLNLEQGEMVAYAIDGPEDVISGEEVEYIIVLENTSKVPLANTEIRLNLPDTLMINEITPEPTESQGVWSIGSMKKGARQEITLTGYFVGTIDSKTNIQAIFTYRPANFNSDFQDITTKRIEITDSVIDLEITGPESALPGEELTYEVTYENTGEIVLENLELWAVLPTSFIITSTEPTATDELQPIWSLYELPVNQEEKITIKGTFASDVSGAQNISFQAGVQNDNEFTLLKEVINETDIIASDFALHLITNGSDKDQSVDLGDELNISIDYANAGENEISDITLTLSITTEPESDTDLVDWSELEDSNNGRANNNTIVWTSSQIDDFGGLVTEDSGIIDITIPVIDSLLKSDADKRITLIAEAELGQIGDIDSNLTVQSTPISIMINSDLSFASESRYFDADGGALGSGPWPPVVDEETNYRVFWKITNSLHELGDLEVTTVLPADIDWSGRTNVDAGSLTFNESTRTVKWAINKMPTSINELTASFEVTNTPTSSNVGKYISLTENSQITGTDSTTEGELGVTVYPVTSNLPNDEYAIGSGIVIEETEVEEE